MLPMGSKIYQATKTAALQLISHPCLKATIVIDAGHGGEDPRSSCHKL